MGGRQIDRSVHVVSIKLASLWITVLTSIRATPPRALRSIFTALNDQKDSLKYRTYTVVRVSNFNPGAADKIDQRLLQFASKNGAKFSKPGQAAAKILTLQPQD